MQSFYRQCILQNEMMRTLVGPVNLLFHFCGDLKQKHIKLGVCSVHKDTTWCSVFSVGRRAVGGGQQIIFAPVPLVG